MTERLRAGSRRPRTTTTGSSRRTARSCPGTCRSGGPRRSSSRTSPAPLAWRGAPSIPESVRATSLSPGSTTRPTMPSLAPPRAPWSMTCTRSPLTSPSTQRCPPVEVLSLVATIHVTWLRSSPDARWPLPSPAVSVRARRSPGLTFLRVLPTIVWLLGFVGEIRGPEKPDRRPAVAVARVTRLRRSRGRNPARPPRVRQIFLDWSAPSASRATAFAAAERHDDVAIADIESRGDRPERCDPARYRLWGTGHGAVTDIFFTCLPCFSRRWLAGRESSASPHALAPPAVNLRFV